jgi:hypothetical protein
MSIKSRTTRALYIDSLTFLNEPRDPLFVGAVVVFRGVRLRTMFAGARTTTPPCTLMFSNRRIVRITCHLGLTSGAILNEYEK